MLPSVPTPRRNRSPGQVPSRSPAPLTGLTRPGRNAHWRRLVTTLTLACVTALTAASTTPAGAATAAIRANQTITENWAGTTTAFHANTPQTRLLVVPSSEALDGSALNLRMGANPEPGPRGGPVISTNRLYRYGRFATRMRTADCTGLDRPGVVTGAFTYGADTSDANHNGITDNAEIDIEVLCAQPEVVYLSIWTDYSETGNRLAEITRAINLRTGAVLSNCYITSYGSGCQPALTGENSPATLTARPGFNSATQFHAYTIDWQPDHVIFSLDGSELWNYRGPRSRIPGNPSWFMQNVSYTKVWNPLNGPAHNQPARAVSALVDSTSTPR